MSTDKKASLPGLTEQAQLVVENRGIVRKVMGKLKRLGIDGERKDLIGEAMKGLVEFATSHDGSAGFPRGAWLRVEGSVRDYLRKERNHRRLIVSGADIAGAEFIAGMADDTDPYQESDEQARTTQVEEAYGLVAARMIAMAGAVQGMNPEEIALAREDLTRTATLLEEAIGELPMRDRELLHLHYHEGLPLTEVAERMRIPYPSLTRFHRDALIRLGIQLRKRGLKGTPHQS